MIYFRVEAETKKIFTIGTSSRSEEDFIEILLFYRIEVVIDVRSYPKSKIPTFNQAYLSGLLQREGLQYVYMGRELGGLRKGGYGAYAKTEEFRLGIEKLEGIATVAPAVVMCAERFPWKCHRRWIARELHFKGWTIEHIIDKGKLWIPK
ncbi:MAG TPA: DUF488 domain-containing protein [Dissulfurispiraceae bacterium]|nr:DUF488 domain-containing protein [Dissulfurispiraceae bacterium]